MDAYKSLSVALVLQALKPDVIRVIGVDEAAEKLPIEVGDLGGALEKATGGPAQPQQLPGISIIEIGDI
jgi:hypothetical protein